MIAHHEPGTLALIVAGMMLFPWCVAWWGQRRRKHGKQSTSDDTRR